MSLTPISPVSLKALLEQEGAVLVDVREPDEYARLHVKGALSRPLSQLGDSLPGMPEGRVLVFTCRSGMRTGAHCDRLGALAPGEAHVLAGGVDAWVKAGLPIEIDRSAPLEIMRQVQIGAGALVLVGLLLAWRVNPAWAGLSAFVGAGLVLAGATGFCGMARLLAMAPWNRR